MAQMLFNEFGVRIFCDEYTVYPPSLDHTTSLLLFAHNNRLHLTYTFLCIFSICLQSLTQCVWHIREYFWYHEFEQENFKMELACFWKGEWKEKQRQSAVNLHKHASSTQCIFTYASYINAKNDAHTLEVSFFITSNVWANQINNRKKTAKH